MLQGWIKYTSMFLLVILAQVLIFNQIDFSGFLNPYFYVLFILLLPLSVPRYLVLFLSFALGFIIDVFVNTPGIHAGATVLMGFVRAPVIDRLLLNTDIGDYPGLHQTGFRWFLAYSSSLILVHHTFLFLIEVFSFNHLHITLLRVLVSTFFTLFFVILSQYLVYRK